MRRKLEITWRHLEEGGETCTYGFGTSGRTETTAYAVQMGLLHPN